MVLLERPEEVGGLPAEEITPGEEGNSEPPDCPFDRRRLRDGAARLAREHRGWRGNE